jgi:peptidoglycan/xylan/chitin deacetylase (PgdA/CDA1 family)
MNDNLQVLMYHSIKTDSDSVPANREIGAEIYDLCLEKFASQMTWLSDNNYQVVTLDRIDKYARDKQVILTFDDGEMNNFIHALPVLQRFQFKAYFFIIIDRIGQPGYMGWDELRQLRAAGMEIGSHGLTHRILTELTDLEVKRELDESLKCLVSRLDDGVDTLSIPRGFYHDWTIELARELGYRDVFISDRTGQIESNCWERVAVRSSWDLKRFEQAIAGIQPVKEQIFDRTKNIFKKVLTDANYNRLRNILISASN